MYTPLLISVLLWGPIYCNAEPIPHHIILREDVYELFYDYNEENVTFEVHVATNGYFGFGISPNGGMADADIVIGWVKDGEVFFHDRHATRNAMPIVDEQQDWTLEFGSENDTHTIMRFHRAIKNCDPEDMDITDTTTRLIWSYALEDPTGEDSVFYHGADRRGTKSVQLLNAMLTPPSIPDDAISVDLTVKNLTVPESRTVYWCEIVEIPEMDTDHHLIMSEPVITPGNEAYAHHMIAYMCPETMTPEQVGTGKPCVVDNMPQDFGAYKGCNSLLLAWAVGGEKFYYPEHTGIRIGPSNPIRYLRLETHYDNPELKNDIVDSSGFRIWLTPTLREYDAGVMLAGVSVTANTMQFIPYNAKDYMSRGHCTQECLSEVLGKDKINVFSAVGHTHLIGSAVKVRHFRNKVELPHILDDQHYDFNFQEFVHLKEEVVVQGTDSIVVDCHYKTLHRDKVSYGGFATNEEMCLTFMMYYPVKKLTYCDSQPTPIDVLGAMNVKAELVASPPYYKVTAPEKYVNQNIHEIVEKTDWNEVELQKSVEKAAGSGWQFARCTYDFQLNYDSSYKPVYIDESALTYREERSCKEHDDPSNEEDDKSIEATKDPAGTDGNGTNEAAVKTLSFSIIYLTLSLFLLC